LLEKKAMQPAVPIYMLNQIQYSSQVNLFGVWRAIDSQLSGRLRYFMLRNGLVIQREFAKLLKSIIRQRKLITKTRLMTKLDNLK
jgi:hypothetical protein